MIDQGLALASTIDNLPRKLSLTSSTKSEIQFTIGVLVTKYSEYSALRESFNAAGFGTNDCEFIYIDNTETNTAEAYAGLNRILNEARGGCVILCHQDVRLSFDNRTVLESKLSELDRLDKNWGLAGNAGFVTPKAIAMRITDIYGHDQSFGNFPAKVMSLDENFLIVRTSARLGFSNNLAGYHFYGTDICLQADIKGYNAYVIDFHLHHLGQGIMGDDFFKMQSEFQKKWNQALRARLMRTTCVSLVVGHVTQLDWNIIFFNADIAQKKFINAINLITKRFIGCLFRMAGFRANP